MFHRHLRFCIVLSLPFVFIACGSKPIIPTSEDIKVSREDAKKGCREMGTLTGRTPYATGTKEQALEDLKEQAANKGWNYVQIKSFSDNGTAVSGLAYDCP